MSKPQKQVSKTSTSGSSYCQPSYQEVMLVVCANHRYVQALKTANMAVKQRTRVRVAHRWIFSNTPGRHFLFVATQIGHCSGRVGRSPSTRILTLTKCFCA